MQLIGYVNLNTKLNKYYKEYKAVGSNFELVRFLHEL